LLPLLIEMMFRYACCYMSYAVYAVAAIAFSHIFDAAGRFDAVRRFFRLLIFARFSPFSLSIFEISSPFRFTIFAMPCRCRCCAMLYAAMLFRQMPLFR